ncbi:MAG: hypothetical protein JKY65_28045, partial [Planctomycetes bacterium]|nr:hypothetical protein [Planctomycetota bacterium]
MALVETANAPPVLPETPSDSAAGLPAPAPPAPSLPPLWASLLALGVVVLAVGLPLGWLLPDGSTYPLGVTTRVLGGLLVVWALIQVAHPERVSIRARRALLVSAFLLAAALAALLLGSG